MNSNLPEDFKNNQQNIFYKSFPLHFDNLINNLLQKEINFYAFTLNFPDYIYNKEYLINNIYIEIEKFKKHCLQIDLIEFVYFSIEIHGEKQKKRELLKQNNEKELILFDTSDKTLKGLPHFHGIIAIRSILGIKFHKEVLNNLKTFFLNPNSYRDILITSFMNSLDKEEIFLNIKTYFNYITKEKMYNQHYFIIFSKLNSNFYSTFFDLITFFQANKIPWLNIIYNLY